MGKRYVGERILQNCGEYAEIIELLPNNRCVIRFDSGVTKVCKRFSFSGGRTSYRVKTSMFIGKRVLQKCGEYAEVIELLQNDRYVVRFDSGVEKECNKFRFEHGCVSSKENKVSTTRYVGERILQNCGEYAEIIELLPNGRCRIRFDNGVEKECDRTKFSGKSVSNESNILKRYIGERILQNCGEYAEIVELLPNSKCRVRFDSGVEKVSSRIQFASKGVSNKTVTRKQNISNRYVGERILQKSGEYAELIELLPNRKCRVKFDSGEEIVCCREQFVKKGLTSNCTRRYVGERVLQSCGEWAELIELLPDLKCRVRFDNGIEKVCIRSVFTGGSVAMRARNIRHVGERQLQNCGAVAEIIELLDNGKCKVMFEDGEVQVCERPYFTHGSIVPPILGSHRGRYRYTKTDERVLSMYFDKVRGRYIGLLRRKDKTHYMRVLD